MWQDKTKWFAAAAALFVVGTTIPLGRYFMEKGQLAAASADQAKITSTLEVAKPLSDEWTTIESAGADDRARIASVKSLESFRGMWINILNDVTNALPKPQPELLSGDVTQMKAIPRGERKLVQIESLNSVYYPDIATILAAPTLAQFVQPGQGPIIPLSPAASGMMPDSEMDPAMMGMEGMVPPATVPPPAAVGGTEAGAARGFLVTVKCLSPNKAGHSLVQDVFVDALKKIQPDAAHPHKRFSIPKATVVGAMQVKQDQAKLMKMRTDYQAAMTAKVQQAQMTPPVASKPGVAGFFQRPNMAPIIPNALLDPNDNTPYLDPLLNEDVREDWEVTVVFLVQLDPPAYAPPAPAEGTTPTAAVPQ